MRYTLILVQKNYGWVWTAIIREKRQLADFVVGNRGTETGIKIWNKIKFNIKGKVMSDYWKSYKKMIPECKLNQSKKETYTV